MPRATLTAAKAELFGLLDNAGTPRVAGVDVVYSYLPKKEKVTEPVALAVFTNAITPEFWQLGVALYVNTTDDEKNAQDALDVLFPLIDAATNNGGYGPSEWQVQYPTDRTTHYIATCVYQVGRQDI